MVNTFKELVKNRYSCRKYSNKAVDKQLIEEIIEAARLAPSASNSQPWFFYIVEDKEKINKLAQSMPFNSGIVINQFIKQVPVIIVACKQPKNLLHKIIGTFIQKDWREIDVAIATEHMALMATELGLGTCWIGWYDQNKIKKICHIENKHDVVALLTVGYALETTCAPNKNRKLIAEIIKFC